MGGGGLNISGIFSNGGSGGGASSKYSIIPVTSANFSGPVNCPLPATSGMNLAIFFNENNKFILIDAGEWAPLAGGGFTILIGGFDSTVYNYHFFVWPY